MLKKYKMGIIAIAVVAVVIIVGGVIMTTPEKEIVTNSMEKLSFRAPWFSKGSILNYNTNHSPRHNGESLESLMTKVEESLKNLCGQTDACGKIISRENIFGNNYTGTRFIIQFEGRNVEDPAGYINEYHTIILSSGNVSNYWISASDLQNPEAVKKSATEIVVKVTPADIN